MARFFPVLLVTVAWAAIYLPGLGGMELKGEEGRRILPGRVMMQTGDWVLPWSEGKPYHRKPPLINWSIAASFKAAGGESELAARLPSALSVLLLALAGVRAGRLMAGPHGAWWLPLALLTTIGAVEKGRLAEIDAMFMSLSGIGMLSWLGGWYRSGSPWTRWLQAGVWFGLASLAKGPVALPFFYAIAGIILWRSGRKKELLHPAHFCGLALAVFLPLPWVLAARERLASLPADSPAVSSGAEQTQVWLNQITKRLDPSVIDWKTWPLGPVETLVLLCPWAIAAIVLWRPARKRWWPDLPDKERILLSGLGYGCLISGLVYALLPEGRARFQLPLAAPVCLLAVVLLSHWQARRGAAVPDAAPAGEEKAASPSGSPASKDPPASGVPEDVAAGTRDPAAARWISTLIRLLLLVLTIAGGIIPYWKAPASMLPAMAIILGACPVVWLLAMRLARMEWPSRLFGEATLLAAWGMIFKAVVLMPVMRLHENIRPPALRILEATGPAPEILAMYPGPQPFLFYLGNRTVEISSVRQITDTAPWLLIPDKRLESAEMRGRLARYGFSSRVLTVPDDDGTPYTLLRRIPPSDGEDSAPPAEPAGPPALPPAESAAPPANPETNGPP